MKRKLKRFISTVLCMVLCLSAVPSMPAMASANFAAYRNVLASASTMEVFFFNEISIDEPRVVSSDTSILRVNSCRVVPTPGEYYEEKVAANVTIEPVTQDTEVVLTVYDGDIKIEIRHYLIIADPAQGPSNLETYLPGNNGNLVIGVGQSIEYFPFFPTVGMSGYWESSDSTVVATGKAGRYGDYETITGKKPGTETVTFHPYESGVTMQKSFTVTVTEEVVELPLIPKLDIGVSRNVELHLDPGEESNYRIKAIASPSDAVITWESSDVNVFTIVDCSPGNTKLRGVSNGMAYLIGTVTSNGVSSKSTVMVFVGDRVGVVPTITTDKDILSVAEGANVTLPFTIIPEKGTKVTIGNRPNTSIAQTSVDGKNLVVHGVKAGTTTVVLSARNGSETARKIIQVNVTASDPEQVQPTLTLNNKAATIKAVMESVGYAVDPTTAVVTLDNDNEAILTAKLRDRTTNAGFIDLTRVGNEGGIAHIKITVVNPKNNLSITDMLTVTVKQQGIKPTLVLEKNSIIVDSGKLASVAYEATPSDAVSVKSSNQNLAIAVVNPESGKIEITTMVGVTGDTTIIVTAENDGFIVSKEIAVHVKAVGAPTINLSKANVEMTSGDTTEVTYKASPSNAVPTVISTDNNIAIGNADSGVITISAGKNITDKSEAVLTVTVTNSENDISTSKDIHVTVNPIKEEESTPEESPSVEEGLKNELGKLDNIINDKNATKEQKQEAVDQVIGAVLMLDYTGVDVKNMAVMNQLAAIEDKIAALLGIDVPMAKVETRSISNMNVYGALLSLLGKGGYVKAVDAVAPEGKPASVGTLTNASAVDIKLYDGANSDVPLKNPIELSFELPKNVDVNEKIVLLHYANGDATGKKVEFIRIGNRIRFVVSGFSTFVVANEDANAGGSGNNTSSDNHGSSYNAGTANTGKWIQNETGWWYQYSNKTYPANGWFLLPYMGIEKWYHFSESGYMEVGWQCIDHNWYYFNPISNGTKGALLVNTTTPDGYRVNEKGIWIQ